MKTRALAWTAAALVAAPACIDPTDTGLPQRGPAPVITGTDSIVIGLVGSLSGPSPYAAEDAIEGADLAVHELNRGRGDEDRTYELLSLDDHGSPARARRLIAQLASSEDTAGIVYAGPPEVLPEVEDRLAAAGIPAILVYGDLYSARRLRPHIFQTSPPSLWQARRIVAYLGRDRRFVRVGAIVDDSFAGRSAATALRVASDDAGLRPPIVATYGAARRLGPILERLRDRHAEALVVHGSPADLHRIVGSLRMMGAGYRTTSQARIASAGSPGTRGRRRRSGWWHPQVVGFDLALGPSAKDPPLPPGTAVADAYARGAHYLPVPSLLRFRASFVDWWDGQPLGLELRAYEAARLVGWAFERASPGDDLARVLEGLRGRRFGGLDIVLGPDDHTTVEQTSLGLWVVPGPHASVPERDRLPDVLPYVPLARTFSIDGERTQIDDRDWRFLFRNPPPRRAPAPRFRRMRFGVTTGRNDPIH